MGVEDLNLAISVLPKEISRLYRASCRRCHNAVMFAVRVENNLLTSLGHLRSGG